MLSKQQRMNPGRWWAFSSRTSEVTLESGDGEEREEENL
jgi:hypothetical protein